MALVNDLGIPTSADRASGVREPSWRRPVVVDALGYHQVTTTRLAAQAGGTRSRYAPPETTHGHHRAGSRRELATVGYASSPVSDPE
ncbi:hypothetical protein O1M63_43550 [Streptomyces mirabilis]|nr:hypothetical protein [Streptomyces mirabilis]